MSYYTEVATIITLPDGNIRDLHQVYRCIVDGLVEAEIEAGRLPDHTEIEVFMLDDKSFGESSIVYFDESIKWNEYYLKILNIEHKNDEIKLIEGVLNEG